MPIANVVRIMRRAVPPHAKISDDAKETIQECVSEFIAFVTEEANERCRQEQRKIITGEDLLSAMGRLGFDNYLDPLKAYLKRYRESEAVGLGKSELASRQRRYANRAAAIQVMQILACTRIEAHARNSHIYSLKLILAQVKLCWIYPT